MALKELSNNDLHIQTKAIAETERMTTIEILWHLRENERRMLYAQMGYKDLKDYCVKELKYSEGSAWRRISAMRLLQELPDIETKIQNGDLNLTQVALVKSHFREVKTSKADKKQILQSLENQNGKATERILAELKPDTVCPLEFERAVRGNKVELTMVLDEDLIKDLEEIQKLLNKSMSKLELLKYMTRQTLEKLRKEGRKTHSPTTPEKHGGEAALERKAQPQRSKNASKNSRYISKSDARAVRARAGNRCQYTDPLSGRRCEAVHNLQIDHIHPFALGGTNDLDNLRLLCPTHNRLNAVNDFGVDLMAKFMSSLKN